MASHKPYTRIATVKSNLSCEFFHGGSNQQRMGKDEWGRKGQAALCIRINNEFKVGGNPGKGALETTGSSSDPNTTAVHQPGMSLRRHNGLPSRLFLLEQVLITTEMTLAAPSKERIEARLS